MPLSEAVITTPRMYFRRFTHADVEMLVELDSDPEVMRFISKGVPTSRSQVLEGHLPRILAWYEEHPHFGYYAAHLIKDDAFIGWFHFRPDRILPHALELGYRLARTYWGRGLATEGSCTLVKLGFEAWEVTEITATALIGNHASHRVMEKAGLRFIEQFIYPEALLLGWTETERAAVRYGISRKAWLAQRL